MKFHLYCKLLSFLTVVSYSESSTNTNNHDSSLHQHQHEHEQHPENHPSSPSPSPNSPRQIGLNVNGRMNCLLWSNPKTSMHPTLTPLFSSPAAEDEENDVTTGYYTPAAQGAESAKDDGEKPKQQKARLLPSLFLPGAVFATTDYRFRKERWYGVERIGMIFRWNLPSSSSNDSLQNKDQGENDEALRYQSTKRIISLPTTIDITACRSLFSPSTKGNRNRRKNHFTSFTDSGSLRVGWEQNEENNEVGFGDSRANNPWIQIGFEEPRDDTICEDDDFLALNNRRNSNGQNPFHLRFFLPLIRRRFDLQWTSRWGNGSFLDNATTKKDMGRESEVGNRQWSSKYRRPNDDPWWMPQVSLDPSMGTFSSENRYRDAFVGRNDRRYWTEFKLRLRTTMPTLLSSVTNNRMGPSDDDDDLQTASLRLDCSLMTDLGTPRTCQSPGFTTVTTARFETIVIPSFWLRSVTETARFGLFHEQNHGVTN